MNIRARAIADWNRLSQSAFGLDITFSTPDGGISATIKGIATDTSYMMDTDGQTMLVRNVHIGFNEQVLLEAEPTYPIRNASGLVAMENHRISFADSSNVVRQAAIKQIYPDNTVGMIMCDCSDANY